MFHCASTAAQQCPGGVAWRHPDAAPTPAMTVPPTPHDEHTCLHTAESNYLIGEATGGLGAAATQGAGLAAGPPAALPRTTVWTRPRCLLCGLLGDHWKLQSHATLPGAGPLLPQHQPISLFTDSLTALKLLSLTDLTPTTHWAAPCTHSWHS